MIFAVRKQSIKDHSSQNISKDNEFKISLFIEDINKIDEEIKDIENNSKKSLEESNVPEDESN